MNIHYCSVEDCFLCPECPKGLCFSSLLSAFLYFFLIFLLGCTANTPMDGYIRLVLAKPEEAEEGEVDWTEAIRDSFLEEVRLS